MKIAVIRKKYTFHGGAESFLSSLMENLADHGHEIHIFAIKWQGGTQHENIHFHKIPAITFISFIRDLSFVISSFFILWRKRKYFDIIQTHDKTLFQDIYRATDGCHIEWLKQRCRRNSLISKLSIIFNPYHWLSLALELFILKGHRFSRILAISQMVKNNMIENYGVQPDDIEVIYNGVDIKKYHPDNRQRYREEIRHKHGLEDNDFVALFVGSGFERKGVKYLIKAIESVPSHISLLIVGRGPRNKYSHLIQKQNVIFCGPQEESYKYYAAADIFVFPSIYEPFGNVHLEALASGLPVITTRNSGGSEIIKNGKQGFVTEKPEDIIEISEKITFLMNRDVRTRMGIEARKLAEEFSFEKHIDRAETFYKNIILKKSADH